MKKNVATANTMLLLSRLYSYSSEFMDVDKKKDFENQLKEYNSTQTHPVIHINTTFECLANAVYDAWKYMRMQLAGTTIDFNVSSGVYYDKAERGFRAHDYLGLYTNKSVRVIGKICARITAVETEEGINFNAEFGELTVERKGNH